MEEFRQGQPKWIVKTNDGSLFFSRKETAKAALAECNNDHNVAIGICPFPVHEDPVMQQMIYSLIELTADRNDGGLTGWLLDMFAPAIMKMSSDV